MDRRIIVFLTVLLWAGIAHCEVAVRVQRVQYAYPGDQVSIAINLVDSLRQFETGGFDLTLRADTNLALVNIVPGSFITNCQWEYFTHSQINPYESHITALADVNNGAIHPTCFTDSSAELAVLTYNVPFNLNLIGKFLTIRFKWYDCGDNSFSSKLGDQLYISHDVYDFDGQNEYLITRDTTFPTLFGAPSSCLPGDSAAHVIDFYNGGVGFSNHDVTPPTAQCPGDTVVPAQSGVCGATVTWQATVTDDRPGATISCQPPPGSFFPVGSTLVRCIAVDAAGNRDTCQFTVTVNDVDPPVITCPADTVVPSEPGQCYAAVSFEVTAADSCSAVSVTASPPSGSFFGVGTTTVEAIAVDSYGNADTCTFDITVQDTQPAVATCPNDTTVGNDPGTCGAAVSFALHGSDNCIWVSTSSDPASGTTFPVGATPVQVIASDMWGQADTCFFTVTVIDTESPVLQLPDSVVVANDPGRCGAVVDYSPNADDNCGGVQLSVSPSSGSFFPIGLTSVSVLAIDSSGNTAFGTFSVTVTDTEPPRLTLPDTIFAGNDPGACGATVPFGISVADNCGTPAVTTSIPSGSFLPIGEYVVSASATDANGLSDSGTFAVVVRDTEPPVIDCPGDIQTMTDSGAYTATVQYNVSADDNCGVPSLTVAPSSGTAFPVGTTVVAAVATDSTGNKQQCSFDVTVVLDDPDSDGVPSWEDNCPNTPNPDQADANGDGIGDACCCAMRGDVDADGTINVGDLTSLVQYLLAGGEAPPCPEQADVDGVGSPGGTLNVSDITFLVAYLFKGGTAPPPCG